MLGFPYSVTSLCRNTPFSCDRKNDTQVNMVYTEFILVLLCRKLIDALEKSVPGISQYQPVLSNEGKSSCSRKQRLTPVFKDKMI
jgi:hypothetical protein